MSARPLVSLIVPTIGRPTLARLLASVRAQAPARAVELIVVGDTHADTWAEPLAAVPAWCRQYRAKYYEHDGGCHCVGQPQRQAGMQWATGPWLLWSQDDSWLRDDAWAAIQASIAAAPPGPRLFRVMTQWGFAVWRRPHLVCGDCDADGILVPNDPPRLGRWGTRYEGDYDFLAETVARWEGQLRFEPALIAVAEPAASRQRPA